MNLQEVKKKHGVSSYTISVEGGTVLYNFGGELYKEQNGEYTHVRKKEKKASFNSIRLGKDGTIR